MSTSIRSCWSAAAKHAKLSNMEPKPGSKYRHYKGNEYEVVCVATMEADMTRVVVYQDVSDALKIWARPLSMFVEEVEVDGIKKPRFEYIGE